MNLDASILTALRGSPTAPVSGGDLAQKLGVTRAAIWARIQELRGLGYDIEASPHQGYRLRHAPDVLLADDLLSRLGKMRIVGRDIRVFTSTTSTNDIVEKLARDDVKEGAVVFAESQTRGRGRLGRKWVSPAGKGLWFSVLLRPDLRPEETTQITIMAATSLARAIRNQTGLPAQIKWPNDILVRGRKVAGSLLELAAEPDHVKYIILGIGLDVNLTAADFSPELRRIATSLRIEADRLIHRAELTMAILRELDRDYGRVRSGRFEAVAEEWERHCSTLGQHVAIRMGDRILRGRAESLDTDGALLLRTEHGRLERIVGGDLTLEKEDGRP